MNEIQREQHRLLGLRKGELFKKIAKTESQQIALAGETPLVIRCDIEGCNENQKVLHLVDDHGVDVWLCDEHYRQHQAFERKIKRDLKKALKK